VWKGKGRKKEERRSKEKGRTGEGRGRVEKRKGGKEWGNERGLFPQLLLCGCAPGDDNST